VCMLVHVLSLSDGERRTSRHQQSKHEGSRFFFLFFFSFIFFGIVGVARSISCRGDLAGWMCTPAGKAYPAFGGRGAGVLLRCVLCAGRVVRSLAAGDRRVDWLVWLEGVNM